MKTRTIRFKKENGIIVAFDSLCYTLQAATSTMPNGDYTCTIARVVPRRSIDQNRLLWLWLNCIADETGNTAQVCHDYYCDKYLRAVETLRDGRQFYRTRGTSGLDSQAFTEFLNKVQADAASEFGILLPQPSDLAFEAFAAEYRGKIN